MRASLPMLAPLAPSPLPRAPAGCHLRPLTLAVSRSMGHVPAEYLPPSRGTMRIRRADGGFSLMEIMLVTAGIIVLTGAIYAVYAKVDAARRVDRETKNLEQMTQNILGSFASSVDFSSVSTAAIRDDGLIPTRMVDAEGNVRTEWKEAVEISPVQIDGFDQGVAILYNNVPAAACSRLVASNRAGFYDIRVGGSSILRQQDAGEDAEGNPIQSSNFEDGSYDPTRVAQACSGGGGQAVDIEFIIAKNNGLGVPLDASLEPCTLPSPSTETRSGTCPSGQSGSLTEQRTASCPSPYGAHAWSPWTTASSTCAPNCVLPVPATQTETAACPRGTLPNPSYTRSRTATCPEATGPYSWGPWSYSGSCAPECVVPRPQTQTLSCPPGQLGQITQERTGHCPAPTGPHAWGPWTTVSDTCTPQCAPPPPETRSIACPAGQLGAINQQRTATCPAPTGPYTWGQWTETSRSCTPQCVAPPPESRLSACPPGQVGAIAEQRVASCPAPTGPYVWGDWQVTSNTCSPACVAPAPQTRVNDQTLACGTGYGQYTQVRNERRDASCPSPTGSYVWGSWYGTSPWTVTDTSCYTCPNPQTAPQSQYLSCPSGQYGQIRQDRTIRRDPICPTTASTYTWGDWYGDTPWSTVSSTCTPCPSPQTSYEYSTGTCPAGQLGSTSLRRAIRRDATCSGTSYTWGSWYPSPTTAWTVVSSSCAPQCTLPNPSYQTRNLLEDRGCPSGYTGQNLWYQPERRDASCPAPTGSYTWGNWYDNGTAWQSSYTCKRFIDTVVVTCDSNKSGAEWKVGPTCSWDVASPGGYSTWYFAVGDTEQPYGSGGIRSTFANPSDWSVDWQMDSCSDTPNTTCSWGNTSTNSGYSSVLVRHLPTGQQKSFTIRGSVF